MASQKSRNYVYVATITQGLEDLAIDELKEADSSVDFISSERGSSETSDSGFDSLIVQKHVNRKRSSACSLVKFRSTTPPYTLIDRLRLVDGLYLFVTCLDEIPQDDIEQSNQQLCRRFGEENEAKKWADAITTWKQALNLHRSDIKFRVTTVRDGKQNYKSPAFSGCVGEAFLTIFGGERKQQLDFQVSLKKYDMEIMAFLKDSQCTFGLTFTNYECTVKKHRPPATTPKGAVHTSLRADIVAAMIKLADLKSSDIIYDPMCGTSAIPMEAILSGSSDVRKRNSSGASLVNCSSRSPVEFSPLFALASENSVERLRHTTDYMFDNCRKNLNVIPPLDCFVGDATRLPVRTGSIDVVLCDPPYGKRCSSRNATGELLQRFKRELARILRPSSGRAIILHAWKKFFYSFINETPYFERFREDRVIDNNRIQVVLFFLKRTSVPFVSEHEPINGLTSNSEGGVPQKRRRRDDD